MDKPGGNDLMERGRHDLIEFVESVAPTVESTIRTVAEKAPPILEKGQKLARKKRKRMKAALSETLAETLPEPVLDHLPLDNPRRRRRRVRTVLLVGGLAAAGVVVARKVMDSRRESGWQSTYTPRPTGSGLPTASDDLGAASPDEALADGHDRPHRDTTPDDPAYVEQLDGAPPAAEPAEADQRPSP